MKIITVEDPVEYQIEGINQIQVKPQIGLDFSHALRSIVRQDPDIIMIGEMRDLETAHIAIQSALTGHLVLSTCTPTTPPAASPACSTWAWRITCSPPPSTAFSRSAWCAGWNQRTHNATKRCPRWSRNSICAVSIRRAESELWKPMPSAFAPSGYHGRTTIMEFLVMTEPLRRTGHAARRHGRDRGTARSEGMRTMYEDGLVKALDGTTTIEEVLRVTQET